MKEIVLPSKALLKISHVDFEDSWALYQAICAEMKNIEFSFQVEMASLVKDLVFTSFSSPKICDAVIKCFKRCTYNSGGGDLKIDNQTFEPEKAREDYIMVFTEVLEYAVGPFTRNLSAVYSRLLLTLTSGQK